MNHCGGLSLRRGHVERIEHPIRCHLLADLPAHRASAPHVNDHGQIDEPSPGGYISHVGDPERVGCIGNELALDQIGGGSLFLVSLCGDGEIAPLRYAAQPRHAHQARDTVATQLRPAYVVFDHRSLAQLGMNLGGTMDRIAGCVNQFDMRAKCSVPDGA